MNIKKIIGILFFFIIISIVFLIGYIFSSYKNHINSKKVLKWSFNSPNQISDISLSKEKLFPGSKGEFEIEIDAEKSETGISYKINVLEEKNLPNDFYFFAEIKDQNENIIKKTDKYSSFSKLAEENLYGDILVEKNNQKRFIIIYWEWSINENENNIIDIETLNNNSWKYEIYIEVIGKQI